MQELQIFVGKYTGFHTGIATDAGDDGNDWFYDDTFDFNAAGVTNGSYISSDTGSDQGTVTGFADGKVYTSADFIEIGYDYKVAVTNSQYSDIEYTRLELFKDETIELTQNIKDFKDVSKVLTDYTKQFNVPASKVNNKVFKHYYNESITNGFDARFRVPCILKLNGIDWKEGQLRLSGVDMKDGSPQSYKVTFFGNTVSLNTLLGDDELDSLPYLDAFNHDLSFTNVSKYAENGADLTYDSNGYPTGISDSTDEYPDLIYPFISSKNRYYVDTADSQPDIDGVRNVYTSTPLTIDDYHGILYTDLKPAIRLLHFVKGIEFKYGIQFSEDFFSFDNPYVRSLYVWLSRESGTLDSKIEETNKTVNLSDLSYSSGTEVREGVNLDYLTSQRGSPSGGRYKTIEFNYSGTVSVTGTGSWDFMMYDKDTNEVYSEVLGLSGNYDFSKDLVAPITGFKTIKPTIKISTKGGITNATLTSVSIVKSNGFDFTTDTCNYTDPVNSALGSGLDIRNTMTPKMKCIDFLKSLFTMFNLVAYKENGVFVVKPLDRFYEAGTNHDITKYVDNSSHSVSRSDIYSEISYEYEKPKTVFAIKSNEATGEEYGNESFVSSETTSFDGGKYENKVKFSHMLYEYMLNEEPIFTGENYPAMIWGYSVSDSFNPVSENFLVFNSDKSFNTFTGSHYFTDGTSTNSGTNGYFAPRNVFYNNEKGFWESINFGSELTTLTVNTSMLRVDYSLFVNFHENYILNIYNPQTRVVSLSARIPLSLMTKLNMNDTVTLKGKRYLINSIKTSNMNELSKMELVSDNYTDLILRENEFRGVNKDGDLQTFFLHTCCGIEDTSAAACASSGDLFGRYIGEDGYLYLYSQGGDRFIVITSVSTDYYKMKDYDYDIIEVSTTGQITDEFNCP